MSKNEQLLNQIQATNGYGFLSPWVKSLGVSTHSFKYVNPTINRVSEATNFLINSFLTKGEIETFTSIGNYLSDIGVQMISHMGEEETGNYPKQSLGEGSPLHLELGEVIEQRRTVRFFSGDKIEKPCLASIIRAAAGITCEAEMALQSGDRVTLNLRSVPSAGGLYPVDLYLVIINVQGIKKGIYRYHPPEDVLLQIGGEEDIGRITESFCLAGDQAGLNKVSCICLLSIHPWKTMKKYGARGLRFALHEVGGISQNIHLAAVSLGLGAMDCASFYEDEVNKIIKLDGEFQTVVHTILLGTI